MGVADVLPIPVRLRHLIPQNGCLDHNFTRRLLCEVRRFFYVNLIRLDLKSVSDPQPAPVFSININRR